MSEEDYVDLVKRLAQMDTEKEWLEFKISNDDPEEIGRKIAALANSAALHNRERAFIVWGIDDATHEIRGTSFKPHKKKIGGEELENWLCTQLQPRVQFWIREVTVEAKACVLFEIEPASHYPISFRKDKWIRVGSYTKPLREHPEKERALWRRLGRESFETGIAAYDLEAVEAMELLSIKAYLEMSGQPAPESPEGLLDILTEDRLVKRSDHGTFHITNLGAILFARDLQSFPDLSRKAVRVIFYKGQDRTATEGEREGRKGYASGFRGLMRFLLNSLPQSEELRRSLRIEVPRFPETALRELVANALIHQDFDISGTGPMIEVFSDRVEVTNPGTPLIDVQRFLDLPPRSRNEKLAHLMRRLRICEERGSGIDKVLTAVELFQLPAPDFQVVVDHTKAILFAPREFADMTKRERVRACYQHAGLLWISNQQMSNETLRKRFGFEDHNHSQASRIITDTLSSGFIKQYDPANTSKRHARYVPFWA